MEDGFVYCHDVSPLVNALGCPYVPNDWRLFIDSSKQSLKCVLLHNGNKFSSIPIGHSGQQSGYTKYPCFLCLWDSRAKSEQYSRQSWPARTNLNVGDKNIIHEPLVDPLKILLPPLHIKLGLMKQFVRALDKEGNCFKYITENFYYLSDEKRKAGIFDGPQIRQLVRDDNFQIL
ncbi:hypothetical protein LOD99_6742 [Oopsacas minuta]|uniref:Uncharacterized protein n=1 Tax=Oopsacas minuta TaxID=111878 RepID=A0AAV7JKZ7_9METZ|nr:hypothetical protein LOD99_6742 [Oopsacas minuta]